MKLIYLAILSFLLFCSCGSSRKMQMEIQKMKTDLFYELSSPEYFGNKSKMVFLDFIDYSNLDYYTTTKKKGAYVIPLILYNLEVSKYKTRLGEGSLRKTYREFLTEALLTECNSSTSFILVDDKNNIVPDSTYHLKIKILRNETSGKITLRNTVFLWFDGETIEFPNNRVGGSNTSLAVEVILSKKEMCIFNKTYELTHQHPASPRKCEDSYESNEVCLDNMAESLSQATKKIVENISEELNLLLISQ